MISASRENGQKKSSLPLFLSCFFFLSFILSFFCWITLSSSSRIPVMKLADYSTQDPLSTITHTPHRRATWLDSKGDEEEEEKKKAIQQSACPERNQCFGEVVSSVLQRRFILFLTAAADGGVWSPSETGALQIIAQPIPWPISFAFSILLPWIKASSYIRSTFIDFISVFLFRQITGALFGHELFTFFGAGFVT